MSGTGKRGYAATAREWCHQGWVPGALLVIATILAYQPAWNAGFTWDDDRYVTNNPLLVAPDGLKKIWFSRESPSQYCPMVYTSFRMERELWGLSAAGSHWINILLHATNACLVGLVLRRLGIPGAWLGAAMFALHPVNVESVAWISERKNVLCLLFYLLALLAWIDFLKNPPARPWRSYVLCIAFYALALFSKTTACTFPAAMVLVLWLRKIGISRGRAVQIAPLMLMGLGMGLLTMWWERYHQGTAGKLFSIGIIDRVLIASRAVFFYLGKLIWPANLMFSYPKWSIHSNDLMTYLWLLALVCLFALVWFFRRYTGRSVETALVFYIATLSPLLGFVMLYTFRFTYVADHYQYIACIGPLALAGAGLTRLDARFQKFRGGFMAAVSTLLLAALALLTWRQCGMYSDAETLWRRTIARNPSSYLAHNNLGTILLKQGRTEEAIGEFRNVIELVPEYEVAHFDLGNALVTQGRRSEAVTEFRKAVEIDPAYAKAHNNLGNLLLRQGKSVEALTHYETALRLRPKVPDYANNVAWVLATSPDDAVRSGERSVALAEQAVTLSKARQPVYLATLAAAYAEIGRFPEAVGAAQKALELTQSRFNGALATALAGQIALYHEGKPFRDTQLSAETKSLE